LSTVVTSCDNSVGFTLLTTKLRYFAARCYEQAWPMLSCGVRLSICYVRVLCRNG